MRNEVTIGGILGLILGGLVTFVLAQTPSTPAQAPSDDDLAPLEITDWSGIDDHESASTDGGHRPVRPGSQRLLAAHAARS